MYSFEDLSKIVDRAAFNLNISDSPANLYEPVSYMLSIGGKRLRPMLCLTVFSLFDDNIGNEAVMPALALEVFHEFTLIHDDIMDRADTRRGQETVHRKWNENIAILSGDAMMILSYRYLSAAPEEKRSAVFKLFTDTALQVCEGQQYDMDYEESPFIVMDDYMKMIGLKTAVLIACSAEMGTILAGAPESVCEAVYRYGYKLGLAFQITDDYLDTFGDEKIFGKKIGGDIENNKKSWLLVECMRRAQGEDKNELDRIMKMGMDRRDEKVALMQDLYERLGVKQAARKEILKYHSQAMSALAESGLDADKKQVLADFAEKLIHREK